jgi:hypothetical protein
MTDNTIPKVKALAPAGIGHLFCPHRLISLADMIKVSFSLYLDAENVIQRKHTDCVCRGDRSATVTDDESKALIGDLDAIVRPNCERLELKESIRLIVQLRRALSGDYGGAPRWEAIQTRLLSLWHLMWDEIREKQFTFIPLGKAGYLEKDKLFGDAVFDAFEEAHADIKDAGNCLAADLNTAAVFHLMRVVEFGLRELAARLKAKTLIKKLKATKIPIELGTWEEIINTLETKLDQLRNLPRNAKRAQRIETTNELLKEFRSIKDLWRNKVMHTRAVYDADQAESAFKHVRNFMQRLTEFR